MKENSEEGKKVTEIFDEQNSRISTSKSICNRHKKLHTIPIGDVALREKPATTNHPIDRSVTGCVLRRNKSKKIIRIKLKRKVQLAKSHYGSIGFAGGDTNLYAYVGGNPMSLIDPTGTTWRDVNIINVIIGGGLVGGGATLIAGGTTTGATVIGAPLATVGVIAGTAGVLTGGAMLVNEWHNFLRPPVEFTIKNQFRPVCSVR